MDVLLSVPDPEVSIWSAFGRSEGSVGYLEHRSAQNRLWSIHRSLVNIQGNVLHMPVMLKRSLHIPKRNYKCSFADRKLSYDDEEFSKIPFLPDRTLFQRQYFGNSFYNVTNYVFQLDTFALVEPHCQSSCTTYLSKKALYCVVRCVSSSTLVLVGKWWLPRYWNGETAHRLMTGLVF